MAEDTELRRLQQGLQNSINEEKEAVHNYRERQNLARKMGDNETTSLYEEIINEERVHEKEFSERKHSLELQHPIDLLPDSPEYMAETMSLTGWKNQLDTAFAQAIERARR
jgi:rubrerythrin